MHPSISYQLAQARIADLHRQARHHAIARAARQARSQADSDAGPAARRAAEVLARRLRTALAARSA